VKPPVKQALAAPVIETFSFTQIFSGNYSLGSSAPNTVGNYNNQGPITASGGYTATFNILANAAAGTFSSAVSNQPFVATSIINVSGPAGGPLSGTMQVTATMGGTSNLFNFSGPVTLPSSSNITFNAPITGNFTLGTPGTVPPPPSGTTSGTWIQKK